MSGFISLLQGDPAAQQLTPALGHTSIGITAAGSLFLKQADGTVTVLSSSAPGFSTGSNASGSTEIEIDEAVFLAVLAILGGSPRTINIILDIDEAEEGWQCAVNLNWPDIAGFVLQFRNGTSGGSLLSSFTTPGDGVTLNGEWQFFFDGSAWNLRATIVPAHP